MPSRGVDKPTVRLAIIGCGAVTEICHLPAVKLSPEVEIVALTRAQERCISDRSLFAALLSVSLLSWMDCMPVGQGVFLE